jgi:hypothetical protein
VSVNAWVGDAEPKIAFDATPHATERRHLSNFVREERGTLPRPGRNVDVAATVALLQAVKDHAATNRLRRAIAQYAMALGHWKDGHETMALAHLYIGMEALTPAALRRERHRTGLDDDGLASRYRIDERRKSSRAARLQAVIRREVLFQGDAEAASKARQASDGFEHDPGLHRGANPRRGSARPNREVPTRSDFRSLRSRPWYSRHSRSTSL